MTDLETLGLALVRVIRREDQSTMDLIVSEVCKSILTELVKIHEERSWDFDPMSDK